MILNSLLVVVDYIFITTLVNTITRRSDCPRSLGPEKPRSDACARCED